MNFENKEYLYNYFKSLSDYELAKIVTERQSEYTEEAFRLAQNEFNSRGLKDKKVINKEFKNRNSKKGISKFLKFSFGLIAVIYVIVLPYTTDSSYYKLKWKIEGILVIILLIIAGLRWLVSDNRK